MRKHFYFIMSIIFWLFMVIGFSDNWLYDTQQPSNFIPKFIIHAFFAFSWFSLLVVQTGLIRQGRIKAHKRVGIWGMTAFGGMIVSTGYLYVSRFLEIGYMSALSQMVSSQYVFAIVLASIGFVNRKSDVVKHKTNVIFASLMLMQPAIDRAVEHVLDDIYITAWLSTYAILFGLFIWYYKEVKWQLTVGFIIWFTGLINLIRLDEF